MERPQKPWLFWLSAIACLALREAGCGGTDEDLWARPTLSTIVLSPHPDDESIMAAATLYRAAHDPRTSLEAVFLTSGNKNGLAGPCLETSEEEKERKIVELREQETRGAWSVIGGDPSRIRFLRYPDRGLVADSTLEGGRHADTLTEAGEAAFAEAADLLPRLVPEEARTVTLVTTSVWDAHPDHRTAYWIAVEAGRRIQRDRGLAVTISSGIVHDESIVDISFCCVGDAHWPNPGPALEHSALLDLPARPRPPPWNTTIDVAELISIRSEALRSHVSQVEGYPPLCMLFVFKPYFERWMEKTVEAFYEEDPESTQTRAGP